MTPRPQAPDAEPSQSSRAMVLTVEVGGRRLAIPEDGVGEIIRVPRFTRVPLSPSWLLGIANLRGRTMPVVSLARKLGLSETPLSAASRVVVDRAARAGVLVDAVGGLIPESGETTLIDVSALLPDGARAGFPIPDGARAGAARPDGAHPSPGFPAFAPRPAHSPHTQAGGAAGIVSLVSFTVAGHGYALPLHAAIAAIKRAAGVTAIPHTGSAMAGAMPWRGSLLPLIRADVLLGLPVQAGAGGAVLVIRVAQGVAGLIVDRLHGVLRVPSASIDPVPAILTRGLAEARIEGICRPDNRPMLCILSPGHLLDDATMARLDAVQPAPAAAGKVAAAMQKFVLFHIGTETYGLPASAIAAVLRPPANLTRVPKTPDFVRGLIVHRGTIVPVIDQRLRFGAASSGSLPAGGARRVLVVQIPSASGVTLTAGLLVDAVSSVRAIDPSTIAPLPSLTGDHAALFTGALHEPDGGTLLLADPASLVADADRDILAALAEAA